MAGTIGATGVGVVRTHHLRMEVRAAEARSDAARRDEDRATSRREDADRDLDRAQRRFDRYA